jgi:hypothetical protein
MAPSAGVPRTKSPWLWLRGGMSGVMVRLRSGVEGLSRCRIASMEHMFSMGATDISTDVALLCLGRRQVALGNSAAGVWCK